MKSVLNHLFINATWQFIFAGTGAVLLLVGSTVKETGARVALTSLILSTRVADSPHELPSKNSNLYSVFCKRNGIQLFPHNLRVNGFARIDLIRQLVRNGSSKN